MWLRDVRATAGLVWLGRGIAGLYVRPQETLKAPEKEATVSGMFFFKMWLRVLRTNRRV